MNALLKTKFPNTYQYGTSHTDKNLFPQCPEICRAHRVFQLLCRGQI